MTYPITAAKDRIGVTEIEGQTPDKAKAGRDDMFGPMPGQKPGIISSTHAIAGAEGADFSKAGRADGSEGDSMIERGFGTLKTTSQGTRRTDKVKEV